MESEQESALNHKAGASKWLKPNLASWDFLTPFVVCSFLSLPTLLLIAVLKQTVAFGVMTVQGYYVFVLTALWILVPAAALCGCLYLYYGKSPLAKLLTAMLLVLVVASFAYILLPIGAVTTGGEL